MTTLHRWAAAEVGKRQGIVDKFAGDAVMATFNVTGARVDHAALALDAALALRDKAALMDLPVGIGIAVGPAVVSRSIDEAKCERPRLDDEPRRAPADGRQWGRHPAQRRGVPAGVLVAI